LEYKPGDNIIVINKSSSRQGEEGYIIKPYSHLGTKRWVVKLNDNPTLFIFTEDDIELTKSQLRDLKIQSIL
jgi:hypothetical protein